MANRVLLTGLAALMTAFSAQAADDVVNVYNWSDYIDEEVLENFTAETGIKVVYDVFDSNEVLETKLLAGKSGYDVVVPSGTFLARQIEAGVFRKLDQSALSNSGNMWDVVEQRTAAYDPGNAYSVNYMWGTTGIGVNVDMVTERLGEVPTSWAMVFEPENMAKLADCGVHMLDASDEILPSILAYMGKDPNSTDKADIAAAGERLAAIAPHVTKFHSSEYISALANGDICVAVGWSGDVFQARDRADEADNGVSVDYIIPSEGAIMWFDQMAIPADASNVEAAHKFINYLMGAEAIAQATNYVYYANGNLASQPLLEEDVIGDPAIYPDEATLNNLFTTKPYDQRTQRVVTRMWTGVKSGQ